MLARLEDYRHVIRARASLNGIEIPENALEAFARYLVLLSRWNQTVRLTSLDDPSAAVDRLILEPAKAAALVPEARSALMDVGSGGGSPAIPLKVMRPNASLLMVESRGRKAAFLREAARELGLERTTVEATRFGDLGTTFQASMDTVSVRAVRLNGDTLVELSKFLVPGGRLLAFTSQAGLQTDVPADLAVDARLPLVQSNSSWLTVVVRR